MGMPGAMHPRHAALWSCCDSQKPSDGHAIATTAAAAATNVPMPGLAACGALQRLNGEAREPILWAHARSDALLCPVGHPMPSRTWAVWDVNLNDRIVPVWRGCRPADVNLCSWLLGFGCCLLRPYSNLLSVRSLATAFGLLPDVL
jgi:hypothetical protein